MRPYRGRLTCVFLLIVGVSLLSLVFPALTGWMIDFVNGHRPTKLTWLLDLIVPAHATGWSAIYPLLILNAVLLLLRAAALLTRNHLMQTTGMRVTCDLRVAIFSHLQKLSLKFYEERQTAASSRA